LTVLPRLAVASRHGQSDQSLHSKEHEMSNHHQTKKDSAYVQSTTQNQTLVAEGSKVAGSDDTMNASQEAIAQRAFEIYILNGQQPGHCKQNWERAERELCTPPAAGDCCDQKQTQSTGSRTLEPVVKSSDEIMPTSGGKGSYPKGMPRSSATDRPSKH